MSSMPEEYVYLPVPTSSVQRVYALLASLDDDGPPGAEGGDKRERPDAALVKRMYEESQDAHRALMLYLADRPGEWLYTGELAHALDLPNGARSLAGMLGAFGRRANHRYGGRAPWDSEWDPARYESRHRMMADVASAVREVASAAGS
jgi:hypothetical protein